MAEELSSFPAAKRRRKVMSVEDKLEVLKLIDSGTSYSLIFTRISRKEKMVFLEATNTSFLCYSN